MQLTRFYCTNNVPWGTVLRTEYGIGSSLNLSPRRLIAGIEDPIEHSQQIDTRPNFNNPDYGG